MAPLEDFEKNLRAIVAVRNRPQPKLTKAEITAIVEAVTPFFTAYEATIADLQSAVPVEGPAWYGYDNNGVEYTGDMKRDVTHQWMVANGIPEETTLLRATLGERGDGPRARGPVTFYTYPSTKGYTALWVAKNTDLALLQGMALAASEEEEEETEE